MTDDPTRPDDDVPTDDVASDEVPTGDAASDGDGPAAAPEKAARTPNTAAAAASRARRIGGRPVVPAAADTEPDPSTAPNLSRRERRAAAKTSTGTPAAKTAPTVSLGKTSTETPTPRKTSTEKTSTPRSDTPARRSRLVWAPAAVLIAAVVAMAVFFAVERVGGGGATSGSANRQHVLAAAKSCLVDSNSYSYKSLPAFEKKGLACGTGTFATQFKASVEKVLDKNAAAVKQTQTFQVNYAGIVDVTDKNQWDILIYGQVNVTNVSTGKTGRVDPYGAIARMQKVHGAWRLSNLATLCSSTILQSGNKCS